MAKIIDTTMQVFVTYKISPLSAAFEESLYGHLLKTVWGDSNWVDEDIRVIVNHLNGKPVINEVWYQFGERYDEDLAEEIGELIDEQIQVWQLRTSVADVMEA
jgi:hypothetical protein